MGAREVKGQVTQGPPSAEERARILREELSYHEHRYHVLEYPLISSEEYWAMRRELSELERGGVGVAPDSASLRTPAAPRDNRNLLAPDPIYRPEPIVTSETQLERYQQALKRRDPRGVSVGGAWLSGCPIELRYVDGVLATAGTRARAPIDILDNVRTIGNVPLRLRPAGTFTESRVTLTKEAVGPSTIAPTPASPITLTVRGTVTMRNLDLQALDRRRIDAGVPLYLSAKAAVEASLLALDPSVTDARHLCFFAESVGESIDEIETHWQLIGALKSWGFAVSSLCWRCESHSEVLDFINALQKERPHFDFPMEGGAITQNVRTPLAANPEQTIGDIPPRIHLRFARVGRRARVTNIYRAVGRTGAVFPVALLEKLPDEEGEVPPGVPVPAASRSAMLDVQAGAIVRAQPGAVAPRIELESSKSASSSEDKQCPSCGAKLLRLASEPFLFCDNPFCKGRQRARLLHLIGPRGFNLKTAGPELAERLVDANIVTVDKLLALSEAGVDALVPGKGRALVAEIARFRTSLPLWRLLHLCSIPFVGEVEARQITAAARDSDTLNGWVDKPQSVPQGLPIEARRGLIEWLGGEARPTLTGLSKLGVRLLSDAESFAAPLMDRRLVIGGRFKYASMDRLVEEIERRGGRLEPSVSRRTDLVIAGEGAVDLVAHAKAFGAPTVDEATLIGFLKLTV